MKQLMYVEFRVGKGPIHSVPFFGSLQETCEKLLDTDRLEYGQVFDEHGYSLFQVVSGYDSYLRHMNYLKVSA